mmetsp:Transcript_53939/g.144486  ORF Transcript_53939/g.144486 Transcript_53939/m.144486 type:complete len:312 (+) Transcript_53939:518-1453(+)
MEAAADVQDPGDRGRRSPRSAEGHRRQGRPLANRRMKPLDGAEELATVETATDVELPGDSGCRCTPPPRTHGRKLRPLASHRVEALGRAQALDATETPTDVQPAADGCCRRSATLAGHPGERLPDARRGIVAHGPVEVLRPREAAAQVQPPSDSCSRNALTPHRRGWKGLPGSSRRVKELGLLLGLHTYGRGATTAHVEEGRATCQHQRQDLVRGAAGGLRHDAEGSRCGWPCQARDRKHHITWVQHACEVRALCCHGARDALLRPRQPSDTSPGTDLHASSNEASRVQGMSRRKTGQQPKPNARMRLEPK